MSQREFFNKRVKDELKRLGNPTFVDSTDFDFIQHKSKSIFLKNLDQELIKNGYSNSDCIYRKQS